MRPSIAIFLVTHLLCSIGLDRQFVENEMMQVDYCKGFNIVFIDYGGFCWFNTRNGVYQQ